MPTIKVDQEKCIGCGSCEAICPKSFKLKDGKAHPIKAKIDKITCEKEAVDICPVQAISIQ